MLQKCILVTGNQFLSQEINFSQKNLFSLVKLDLLTSGIVGILPKISPEPINFVGTWFPGSR